MLKDNKKIILLVILFVVIMLLVILGVTAGFDNMVYQAVRSINCPFIDKYFETFTRLGNTKVVLLILVVLNLILSKKDSLTVSSLALVTVISNQLIKNIIQRPRPNIFRMVKVSGYSFPSGHAMISATLYGFLLYLVHTKVNDKTARVILEVILSIIIMTICISRIYLGVHYASDVVAGIILGYAEVLMIIKIKDKYQVV